MKKLLISFLIGVVLFFSLAPFSIAKAQSQTTWYNQNPFEWYTKVYDTSNPNEIFGERYTAAQVQWVAYSVFFLPINTFFSLLGMKTSPVECMAEEASGVTDVSTCLSALPDSIDALANSLKVADASSGPTLAQTNDKHFILKDIFQGNRSFSGIAYVKNLANKFSPVATVKAAGTTGFGYSRISVLAPLWTASRNIAYFFFVIFMLVAAFMIMFKVKISPQAVVTLQSALPKIAVAILLVTFSYAIAGFMIDLVYVVMGLFSQFVAPISGATPSSPNAVYLFLTGWSKEGFIAIFIYSILYIVSSITAATIIAFSALTWGNVASAVFGTIMIVAFAIIAIIIIIYIFVGLFNLFKALAMFYLDVILGPIRLAIGALPQSKGALTGWLKSMISHLAVFPATAALWFFGFSFLDMSMQSLFACGIAHIGFIDKILQALGNAFPTILGSGTTHWFNWGTTGLGPMACWGPPLLGNGATATSIAFLLLSASCILLIGKVPKMIEKALAGERFDLEAAIGEPIKRGVSVVGGGIEAYGRANRGPNGSTIAAVGGVLQQIAR